MRPSWHTLLLAVALLPGACSDGDSDDPGSGGRGDTGGYGTGGAVERGGSGGVIAHGGAATGGAAGNDTRGGASDGGTSGAGAEGGAPSQGGGGAHGGAPEGGAGLAGGHAGVAGSSGAGADGGSAGNAGHGGSGGTGAEPTCEFRLLQKLEPAVRSSLTYGTSLATSSDTVLVGGDRGTCVFIQSGDAGQQQNLGCKLTAQGVGSYAAILGNTAALGDEGGVAIFERTAGTWMQTSTLLRSDDPSLPRTPLRVGFSGSDMLLIGAPFAKIGMNAQQGAVYVFVRSGNTWTQQGAPLVASDAEPVKVFGAQMAVSGNTAIVTSHAGLTGSPGGADVFVRNGSTWTQQGPRLLPGRGVVSVALDGDFALITQSEATFSAVHTFERTAGVWAETGPPLTAPLGDGETVFGSTLALAGDTALIGSPGRAVSQFNQGVVEVFVRNSERSWVRVGRPLLDSQGQEGDRFGGIVAIAPSIFVVQANTNSITQGVGTVFAFSRTCTPD